MPCFGGAGLVRFWPHLDQPDQGHLPMPRSSLLQRRWHRRDFAGLGKSSCYGNSLRRNKNRPSFATFLRLRTLLHPHKLEMSRQKGRFVEFLDRDPHFGAPRQSAIAKKLQFGPIFCFWVPGGRLKGGAISETDPMRRVRRGPAAVRNLARRACRGTASGRRGGVGPARA